MAESWRQRDMRAACEWTGWRKLYEPGPRQIEIADYIRAAREQGTNYSNHEAREQALSELRGKVGALCAANFPGGWCGAVERLKWLHARRCEAGQDRVLLAILRLLDPASKEQSDGET